MVNIIAFGLIAVCCVCMALVAYFALCQLEDMRKEWAQERADLLNRIQSGSFIEYKAQERADKPLERKEKDPARERLERLPWA